ncbi:MAG: hypothetical protein FWE65_00250 [Eggerthellaceae bacterium]|nr:hypothetical protein [Eggerthellaceae bacterium]
MKKLALLAIVLSLTLLLTACVSNNNNTNNVDYSDSPLVGTWQEMEYGFHGNAIFVWSFGADGRFAYLFTAYEPPQAGGSVKSSVREIYMQGSYRVNGGTIECYDVKIDDYFSWGDKWKYFEDRSSEALSSKLLSTKLKNAKGTDSFTVNFLFDNESKLHLTLDRGGFPDQYEKTFELVANSR